MNAVEIEEAISTLAELRSTRPSFRSLSWLRYDPKTAELKHIAET
jgi:hypothetical protein